MEAQIQKLIAIAQKSPKECSKLIERIQTVGNSEDTRLLKTLQGKLAAQMKRGEILENQHFKYTKLRM